MAYDRFQPEGAHLCYDIQHHRGTCRLHRIHLGPFRSFIYNWAPSVSAIFTFLDSFDNTTSTPFLCQRKRSTSPRHCLCSCSHSPLCGSRHSWRLSYPVGSEDPRVPRPAFVLVITWIYGFLCPVVRNKMKSTLLAWIPRQQIYSLSFEEGSNSGITVIRTFSRSIQTAYVFNSKARVNALPDPID